MVYFIFFLMEILSQIYLLIEFDKFHKVSFNFINSISFVHFPRFKIVKKNILHNFIIELCYDLTVLKFSNQLTYTITLKIILSMHSFPFSKIEGIFFKKKFPSPLFSVSFQSAFEFFLLAKFNESRYGGQSIPSWSCRNS